MTKNEFAVTRRVKQQRGTQIARFTGVCDGESAYESVRHSDTDLLKALKNKCSILMAIATAKGVQSSRLDGGDGDEYDFEEIVGLICFGSVTMTVKKDRTNCDGLGHNIVVLWRRRES